SAEAEARATLRRFRAPVDLVADDFFAESSRIRERFARLVGGEAHRVALIPSASYGLATVARNLDLRRGHSIVLASEQFPSNVYPWRRLAAETGATLRTVDPPAEGPRGAGWTDRLLDAIDGTTALVTLGPIHWTDGTRYDLAALAARARDAGAMFVVDGTQFVGAAPFDVGQIQPDALICAGYKWLLGPYGIGVAYYGPRLDGGVPLEENWISREGSENFGGLVAYRDAYQPGAARYDVGERGSFLLAPMLRAALDQILAWRPERITAYAAALTSSFLEDARALGFGVEDAAWRSAHLFGLHLPAGLAPEQISAALAARNVYVSVRGDALRISVHLYNDASDVAALREALEAAVRRAPATAP
ncbi:MAG: aminotransferase class V-fold PLP-dependent enzyme, partial [Rhodothermales bacterium]|nr:aminotransferase class V-fold PLP-dependent enzyme [Rhodothermales bacterium]